MVNLQPLFFDMKSGNYVAKDIPEAGICAKQIIQNNPSDLWILKIETKAFLYNVYVDNKLILPNKATILRDSNSLALEFTRQVSGLVNVLYLVDDYTQCDATFEPELISLLAGINAFPVNREKVNS